VIPPIADLPDPLMRLKAYQAQRAAERERLAVEAAVEKPVRGRTGAEWALISYSPHGTGQGCGR
jgi:hypothetical protein